MVGRFVGGIARSGFAWPLLAGAIALAPASAGCTGKDPYNPGQSLGTFAVEAKLASATCGASQTPPDPWRFDVRLSQEGPTLYWIQGGAPVHGILDANHHTAMISSDSRTLREATKSPLRAACVVRREDALDATLEATSVASKTTLDVTSFHGSLSYRFVPEDGSDCEDVVESGAFDALPCAIAFDLSGTPKVAH
jgi:hypothetical protein